MKFSILYAAGIFFFIDQISSKFFSLYHYVCSLRAAPGLSSTLLLSYHRLITYKCPLVSCVQFNSPRSAWYNVKVFSLWVCHMPGIRGSQQGHSESSELLMRSHNV